MADPKLFGPMIEDFVLKNILEPINDMDNNIDDENLLLKGALESQEVFIKYRLRVVQGADETLVANSIQ